MYKSSHWRKLWARFSLSFLVLGVVFPSFTPVFAAGPGLVINEINWAGSIANSNDDWVELYNASAVPINFGVDNYLLTHTVNGISQSKIADLTAGAIPANGYFLVRKSTRANSSVDLDSDVAFDPAMSDLPALNVQYQLTKVSSSTVVDVAGALNDGVNAPFAGSNCVLAGPLGNQCVKASMYRLDPSMDGSLAGSWRTANTIGASFKSGVVQYGTPANSLTAATAAYSNREVNQPTATVTPTSPTLLDTPTVRGVTTFPATSVEVNFTDTATGITSALSATVNPDNSYTATYPSANPLSAGSYSITAQARDTANNRSSLVYLDYVINKPVLTINSLPAFTNKANLDISGTIPVDVNSIIVNLNGSYYSTINTISGQSNFTVNLPLALNSTNNISLTAKAGYANYGNAVIASLTNDNIAPNAIPLNLVKINSNPPGTNDTVSGLAGAAEPGSTVIAYADSALTQLIGQVAANADASFPNINLFDNKYAIAYLVAKDRAGNVSPSIRISNIIGFVNTQLVISATVTKITTNSAVISWENVPGAISYRLKYKAMGGGYSTPTNLCNNIAQCALSTSLINLNANTAYGFAIAAVDQYGNESPYTEYSFRTAAPPAVVTINATSSAATTDTTSAATTVTAPNSAATPNIADNSVTPPTQSDQSANEQGQVKSTTDDGSSSRNWTPWIVLGVLVALAVLSTTGYFYWFGGEAGEVALSSIIKDSAVTKEEVAIPSAGATVTPKASTSQAPKPTKPTDGANIRKSKDKRW